MEETSTFLNQQKGTEKIAVAILHGVSITHTNLSNALLNVIYSLLIPLPHPPFLSLSSHVQEDGSFEEYKWGISRLFCIWFYILKCCPALHPEYCKVTCSPVLSAESRLPQKVTQHHTTCNRPHNTTMRQEYLTITSATANNQIPRAVTWKGRQPISHILASHWENKDKIMS